MSRLLVVLSGAAALLRANVGRFALTISAVFWLAAIAWIIGSYAHFAAATPADIAKTGVTWSLRLTPEGGLILALIAGLIIGNFVPRFADWLSEAIRPEFYVKIAIVILGGVIAITVAGKLNLASTVFLRSLAAIVEAYLIYWPVVYYISPQIFRLLPRSCRAACLGHFDLRCRRGDRHRQRHPRPAARLRSWSLRSSSSSRSSNFWFCRFSPDDSWRMSRSSRQAGLVSQ